MKFTAFKNFYVFSTKMEFWRKENRLSVKCQYFIYDLQKATV